MKEYVTPILKIYFFTGHDIVTASDPNDNNYSDIEDWE